MLAEITKEIATAMAALSVSVSYDPDRLPQTIIAENRIRVSEGPDSFEPYSRSAIAARPSWVAIESATVTIEGASTKASATREDHRRVVKDLRDAFLVAVQAILSRRRNPLSAGTRGQFVETGADLEQGARYELTFGYERAISATAATTVTDPTITVLPTTTVTIGDASAASCGG